MPDTYVQLPDGSYVQVPSDASPAQLQQFKIKLAGMQGPQNAPIQDSGTIGPQKSGLDFSSPMALGGSLAKPITNYIQQAQNLTPQGAAANPVQNIIGKIAGLAFGGTQGIGTEGHGILTSPVTGTLIGAGPGGSIAEAAASKLPSATAAAERLAAGKTIGKISEVAGQIPVNTAKFGDSLLELFTQQGYGAQFPPPAKKLLARLTAKEGAPLTLEEAKGFQGQITDFLKNPIGANGARIKDPNIFRLMGDLNQGIKTSIEQASQLGGFDPGTFTGAMQQYSHAAQKEAMMGRLHDLATKGVKIGVGSAVGGAAAGLGYDIYKILHPSSKSKE